MLTKMTERFNNHKTLKTLNQHTFVTTNVLIILDNYLPILIAKWYDLMKENQSHIHTVIVVYYILWFNIII